MKGARPLDEKEIARILKHMTGKYGRRNRCLFRLGLYTATRISELLSLDVGDVWKGRPRNYVYLKRSSTKGRREGRSVPLNAKARRTVSELIRWKRVNGQELKSGSPLFESRNGNRLSRYTADKMLRKAVDESGLAGRISTHSMRKTAGTMMMDGRIPLPVISEILGHADLNTTVSYLGVGRKQLEEAVGKVNAG